MPQAQWYNPRPLRKFRELKVNQFMRTNPERTAWIIISIAFAVFCSLAVSLPASLYWYVMNATLPLDTQLTAVQGTVLAQDIKEESTIPLSRGSHSEIGERTMVSTDAGSQAILTFYDDSVVTLYHDTSLIIHRVRRPRFGLSSQTHSLELELLTGRLRASLLQRDDQNDFNIITPQAQIDLNRGSYAVEVNENQTRLTTRAGLATVQAEGKSIAVRESKLTTVLTGQIPAPVAPAEQSLLLNGDFTQPLSATWALARYASLDTVTTTAKITQLGGRSVLLFNSEGESGIHTEVGVTQDINKDVLDFQSLRISADVRVNQQDLEGGGTLGTEYPLRLHLTYEDADGNDRYWYYGFFYKLPLDHYVIYDEPNNSYQEVDQGVWYSFESENLLQTLAGIDQPVYIKSLRVYASGWIYETMISDIKMLAKE